MIVTDSLGIGADRRAHKWGDQGSNTFQCAANTQKLVLPNWVSLGIGQLVNLPGQAKSAPPRAYVAKVEEISNAKDTLAGHWEMMGIETKRPFPVFTQTGFPPDLIAALESAWQRKIVGNKAASGTTIIDELADQEINHQKVIVYTSADSVLQICGHEETMGLKKLYQMAKIARQICSSRPEWNVGRIIARPYVGEPGHYRRTANRHDYALKPPSPTLLDRLQKAGVKVIGVGKISDIFDGQGISQSFRSKSDADGMDITIQLTKTAGPNSFIFVNLVDFDSKYGHRRDALGYAENLNLFDQKLGQLIAHLQADDLLIITSDHGTDPCFQGSDHTSEFLPLTVYAHNFSSQPRVLEPFVSLASVGNLVAKNFQVELSSIGQDRSHEIT